MSLRMILEAVPLCPAAALLGNGPAQSRFASSAEARGVASITGEALRVLVSWAVAHGRCEFVRLTLRGPDRALYRFELPEGRFYAVVTGAGEAVACFGQVVEGGADA